MGSTTLSCLELCEADDTCFAFNYDKVRKWCYLSGEDMSEGGTQKSDARWASGIRQCVDHEDTDSDWNNEGMDFGKPEIAAG